jgi:4-coumarate--CoA ligase
MFAQCPVDDDNAVAGSAGQLVSGAIAKIVKADGTLAGPYEPGEFVVKGPQNSFGYFNNKEA